MQFEHHIGFLTLLIPSLCSGALLFGSSLFVYFYNRTKDKIYLSMTFLEFISFVHVLSETLVYFIGSWRHYPEIAVQFDRISDVSVVFFLWHRVIAAPRAIL